VNIVILAFLPFLLLISSCGYHYGEGSLSSNYSTISVPYIKGDTYGELTAALIKEITRSGSLRYKRSGGDLVFEIAILDFKEEDIGFRYDRQKDGRREKNTIPTETRITAITEVSLFECCSGERVFGPRKIQASVDFDHNYYFGSDHLSRVSLGQVTDIDAARDSVRTPLFNHLAEKIVDTVINSW